MTIDEQIKALQRRKKLIEYLEQIDKYAQSLKEDKDFKGLISEVQELIAKFITAAIKNIENLEDCKTEKQTTTNTPDNKLSFSSVEAAPTKNIRKPQTHLLEFVQKYGKFGYKSVEGMSDLGLRIRGKATQIVYPHIVVMDEQGMEHRLIPDSVKEV